MLPRFVIVVTGRQKETLTSSALHAIDYTSRSSRKYRRLEVETFAYETYILAL
jgi:hypothetical protein